MMTFEEYKKSAFDKLRENLSAHPEEEVEEYIKTLEDDVKESYETAKALTEKTGKNRFSPNGFAYGMAMSF